MLATRSVTRLSVESRPGAKETARPGLASSETRYGTAVGGTSPGPGGMPIKFGRERCSIVGLKTRNWSKKANGSVSANSVRCVIPPAGDDPDDAVTARSRSASYAGSVSFVKARIARSAIASASWNDAICAGGNVGMARVVTSAARCGAFASRAMHASVTATSVGENSSVR